MIAPASKTKAPILSVALKAAPEVGASAVVLLPEGPMDWAMAKSLAGSTPLLVEAIDERSAEALRNAGLIAIEVEPVDAAIAERMTLALIEAVANDQLRAGARVVVVYSGFEADTLDSIAVVRLGEHLERLTSRDLRAGDSGPF